MTNHRHVVTELRELLKSGDLTAIGDEQKKLIDDYSEHVRLANRRLSECEAFLQKELLSEAVQAAKADPDLLDYVTTLDIQERDVLEMLCVSKKWPPPPALSLATYEALNRAYGSLQSMEELLESHRLLALSRAPLVERRNVLLNIIDRDPETQVWKKDQVAWELELVNQLDQFLSRPDALNDPDRVLTEIRVLNDDRWRIDVPKDIRARVEGKRRKAEEAIARRELAALVDPILRAYQGKDEAEVRRLMRAWNAKAEAGYIGPNDEIAAPVRDAFDWLSRREHKKEMQARVQAAHEKVIRVLASDASVIQLRAGWAAYLEALKETQTKPEPDLEHRYRETLERREALGRQRYRLLFISAGAAVALLAIFATFLIIQLRHSSLVAEKSGQLRALLDASLVKGYLTNADVDRLDESVADVIRLGLGGERDIAPIVEEARKKQQEEQDRRKKYEGALAAATATPMTIPGRVGYGDVYQFARSTEEKAKVESAQKDHDARHAKWKDDKRKEALDLVKKIKDAVRVIDQKIQIEAGLDAENLIRTTQDDVNRLDQLSSIEEWQLLRKYDEGLWVNLRVADEARIQRSLLLQKLAQIDTIAKADTAILSVENAFSENHDRVAKFGGRLNDFVRQYATTRRAKRLNGVVGELKAEEALERWGAVVASWKGNPLNFTPDQAAAALRTLPDAELLPAPFRDQVLTAKDLLSRHAKAKFDDASQPPYRFNLNFEAKAIKDSYLVKRKIEGKPESYWYMPKNEFDKQKEYFGSKEDRLISHFNDFENASGTKNQINCENFVPFGLSPAARLSQNWSDNIRPSLVGNERNWRAGMLRALAAIESQEELDPIHRVVLVEKCLGLIRETSLIGTELTVPQRDYIGRAKNKPTGSMLWIDPEQNLDDKRDHSRQILKGYPPTNIKKLEDEGKQAEERLLAKFRQYPMPIAWLDQVEGKAWVLRGVQSRWDAAPVFVLTPGTNNADRQWLQIGTIKEGRLRLTTNQPELLRPGMPCFITVRSSDI